MNRKLILLSAAALPFLALSGCAIGESNEDKSIPIEKIDMSRYEEKVEEGVFKQIFNTKFADVIVDGELKIFELQEVALNQLSSIDENAEIQFIYALNEETRVYEIHSITAVNGQVLASTETEVVEEVVEEDEAEETVTKVKMEVDYENSTQIVEAIPSDFIAGTFNMIDTYEGDSSAIRRKGVVVRFAIVEDTVENDVQKERWRAAGILKEIGDFKEEKDSKRDLDDIKFIFKVETDDVYQEVMLLKNKHGYLRVEIDTTPDLRADVIAEVVAMLNSVE